MVVPMVELLLQLPMVSRGWPPHSAVLRLSMAAARTIMLGLPIHWGRAWSSGPPPTHPVSCRTSTAGA